MPYIKGEKREGGVRTRTQDGVVVYEQDYHFWIIADNIHQSRYDLIATPGLPQTNVTMLGNMVCKSVNIERHPDKAILHEATCTFSSVVAEGLSPSTPQQGDPTAWIPQGTISFEPYQEVLRKDLDDAPFVNSANKPFRNGLVRQRRIASITFTQWEALSADTKVDQLLERVAMNSVEFLGKPVHTLLLQLDRAVLGSFYGYRCWKMQYTLKYKPWPAADGDLKGGWYIQQLDSGDEYYDGTTLTQFLENEVFYEGLLDGSGGKVSNQKTGDPVFLNFRDIELSDFSFLKIRNF